MKLQKNSRTVPAAPRAAESKPKALGAITISPSPSARARRPVGELPLPVLAKRQESRLWSARHLKCAQDPLLCPHRSFRISPTNAVVRLPRPSSVLCGVEHASISPRHQSPISISLDAFCRPRRFLSRLFGRFLGLGDSSIRAAAFKLLHQIFFDVVARSARFFIPSRSIVSPLV